MKNGVLRFRLHIFALRRHLEDPDPVKRPTMGSCHSKEFAFGFGEGYVESSFAVAGAFKKEVQGYGGLAGAGIAFDEVEMIPGKSTGKNVVEPSDTCGKSFLRGVNGFGNDCAQNRSGCAGLVVSAGTKSGSTGFGAEKKSSIRVSILRD